MTVRTPRVRDGRDARLERIDPRVINGEVTQAGHPGHTLWAVYSEMMITCARWFHFGMADAYAMTMSDMRFWYDACRGDLKRATAPAPSSK